MRFWIRDSVFCLIFVAIYVEQHSGRDYIHDSAGSRVARTGAKLKFIVEGGGWGGMGVQNFRLDLLLLFLSILFGWQGSAVH